MQVLEEKVQGQNFPNLIPCTSDTENFQKYVYFLTAINQVFLQKLILILENVQFR